LVHPAVQIKAIKGNTLFADRNFNEIRSDFCVKSVPVHAQIERRIPQPDKPWCNKVRCAGLLHELGIA
jgi:hypothetical protein